MIEYGEADYWRQKVSGTVHHFYITGEIGEADEYIDLLDTLYMAGVEDSIVMHINTGGGLLDTTIQIIHAMRNCQATIVTCADGACYSAGSLLLFSGDMISVGEFCEVMLHDASGGEVGKVNENVKGVKSMEKRLKSLYHSIYGPFFTKQEINKVLRGEDKYLLADELLGRLMKLEHAEEESLTTH